MRAEVARPTRWAYSAPAFALAVVGIPIYVYLPKFYTDVVGLPIGLLGWIILALRVVDAFTDPLIGFWSDQTRTRWGRRKPFMAVGTPLLAVAILMLFIPPSLSATAMLGWFTVGMFLLFLCWTLIDVPYEALGPEICRNYNERTAVLGMREGSLLVGTLVAAVLPAVLGQWIDGSGAAAERQRFLWLALLYVPLILFCCSWCLRRVTEPPLSPPPLTRTSDWRALWQNRPFLILLVAYTISALGSNLPATLILYYVDYVLQSPRADLFLLIYFIVGIGCLPLWVMAGRRLTKKGAWLWAMALNTGAFSGVFLLGTGDELAYGFLVALSGIGLGGVMVLPASMQADTIDVHEHLTGQRRAGKYIGLWSISRKLAAAFGVGLALVLLGSGGYQPGVEQSAETITMLRILYALVPCACNGVALVIGFFYPLTEEAHAAIQVETIDQRR